MDDSSRMDRPLPDHIAALCTGGPAFVAGAVEGRPCVITVGAIFDHSWDANDDPDPVVRVGIGDLKVDLPPPNAARLAAALLDAVGETMTDDPLPIEEARALRDQLVPIAGAVLGLLAKVQADALDLPRLFPATEAPPAR
ncbi:MAG: hypothetical protein ACR2GH_11050 [Pseudonocardia sp.]